MLGRRALRLTRALFIFLLTSILFSSFVALVYSQNILSLSAALPTGPYDTLIVPGTFVFGVTLYDKPPPLNQSTRVEIFDFIKANPGIQFRGICSCLNLPVGVAQYHLGILTKAGLVSFFRDGRYKRYFESKKFSKREMMIISFVRHETTGKILKILVEKKQACHGELSSQLLMSSQALTWQMNCLTKTGIVHRVRERMRTRYLLDEANILTLKQYIGLVGKNACACVRAGN